MKPALFATLALGACASSEPTQSQRLDAATAAISPARMKADIDFLADDARGGRICGSPGHNAAREHVRTALVDAGLEPFGDDGTFVHTYAAEPFEDHYQRQADGSVVPNQTSECRNLVGILRGKDAPDEHVVLVAHYDHLGVTEEGEVFNGAFDDASGTAALIEVARVLVAEGVRPRRSIVFLISDQEEQGLVGAGAWLDDADKTRIIAGIAVDPVGRALLPDHAPIILSGAERSPGFAAFLRGTRDLTERPIGFIHRMMIPVFGSDHDQFYPRSLPAVWLVSPGMSFYHQVTDEPDTIDYAVMREVARYLARLAVRLAEGSERFAYVGEPELDLVHAQDTKDVLVGVTGSAALTASEKERVQGYIAQLDEVLASDWSVIGSPLAFFIDALGFVAFELPRIHPGEIPPPFPN